MIAYVALLGASIGSLSSIRKEYFQISALAHASVLGAALACFLGFNLFLGALLTIPLRAIVIYRLDSLESSTAIFGFAMGLSAYFLAISGSTAVARTILFGSLFVHDPLAIFFLKVFAIISVGFLFEYFDDVIYEAFDPETAYVYNPRLKYIVFTYYFLLSLGTVVLLRFLGAFLTIVVLSSGRIIFKGLSPRVIPIAYFALLYTILEISKYTPSPTGFATFVLAILAGLRSIKTSRDDFSRGIHERRIDNRGKPLDHYLTDNQLND